MTLQQTAERIAADIVHNRRDDISSAADVKWYVAEAQEYVTEPEQVWDEVFHLVCAALDI